MKKLTSAALALQAFVLTVGLSPASAEMDFPQIVKTRYESADPKSGGQFIVWSERERIFYGLDPKLYPAVRFVEVTQVTPTTGSNTLTFIELKTVLSQTSDYLYMTGNVRFRVSGMILKSSNFPAGSGMAP
jgi:hypothetical protein